MNEQTIKHRIIEIDKYLNRNWNGISDHFVERLLARAEYDKLTKELKYDIQDNKQTR